MKYCKQTKKLFFGKYVHKIAVRISVASLFRGNNLQNTKLELDRFIANINPRTNRTTGVHGLYWMRNGVSIDELLLARQLATLLEDFEDFSMRVEGPTLGLYSNDDDLITKVSSVGSLYIEEVSSPETDDIKQFLLSTPKAIIRSTYTHKYKVTVAALGNNAITFVEWANKVPKVKVASKKFKYGGYFYVADQKTLSMCNIFLGDKIRKVEELVTGSEF
jgi:hypothetical protein